MTENPEKQPKSDRPFKAYAKYSGLAVQMGLTIYLGSLLGEYLDEQQGVTNGIYSKFVTLAAVFLSIFVVIRQVTRMSK